MTIAHKIMGLTLTLLMSINLLKAQSARDIVGVWLGPDKDAKVEVYEKDGRFFGKIVWLKRPYETDGKTPRKDEKNKDKSLRTRGLMHLNLLSGFTFENGKWVNGKIYDPKSGKTYSSEIKLEGGKLNARGYIGTPILGRTAVFTRVE